MNDNLHPIFKEALAPWAPPKPSLEKRLEELMWRCREDRHELCYADLVKLLEGKS